MFNEQGFLSSEMETISNNIYNENKTIFDFCFKLNEFSIIIMFDLKILDNDIQQIIGAQLLSKISRGFQSIVLLYKNGLNTEANIILRTILETLYILKAVTIKQEYAIDFVNSDLINRKNLIEEILKNEFNAFDSLKDKFKMEDLEKLKEEIKKINAKKIKQNEWAVRSGLISTYRSAYKVLCSDAHPDINNCQQEFLDIDKDKIIALKFVPNSNGIVEAFCTSISVLIEGLKCVCELTKIEYQKEFEKFEKGYKKIYNSYSENKTTF